MVATLEQKPCSIRSDAFSHSFTCSDTLTLHAALTCDEGRVTLQVHNGETGDASEDAWGRVYGVYDTDGTPLAESAIGNPYLFQGRWYSWALHKAMGGSGLYFFRARWYDPAVGRWLSKDPIGIAGGLNQYVFCVGNPTIMVDPLGLDALIRPTRHGILITLNVYYHGPGATKANAASFKKIVEKTWQGKLGKVPFKTQVNLYDDISQVPAGAHVNNVVLSRILWVKR